MLYPEARSNNTRDQYPRTTAGAAAVASLRQQTFPHVEAPRIGPLTQPEWLQRLNRFLAQHAVVLGALGALVVVLSVIATAIPAWAAMQGSGSAAVAPSSVTALHSSTGMTGTASTRVEDLGASTFVGRIPFVQQLRYFGALAGGTEEASRFVEGARQGSLLEYMKEISEDAALPYLNDAAHMKQDIDTWNAAVAEAERKAAEEARLAAAAAERQSAVLATGASGVWRAPSIQGGTVLPATVTFYACVGNGFCGNMASGSQVFAGAAACSSNLPFGTRFIVNDDPTGRVFTCLDRGALSATWVDVWFYSVAEGHAWQSLVGNSSDITILP